MNTTKVLPRGITIWMHDGIYTISKSAAASKMGEVTIETAKTPLGYQMSLLNENNFPMANTFFQINSKRQLFDITKVKDNFRKMGLGEIRILADIMTLVKNGFKEISLNTCSDGLDYHFKHKFKPKVSAEYGAKRVLNLIERQKNQYIKQISAEAEFLKHSLKNSSGNKETETDIYKKTEQLLEDFLTVNNEHGIRTEHDNEFNVNMVLNRKTIDREKNYFNELAEKHAMVITA